MQVNHIYREAKAADFLASFSLSYPLGLQLLTVAHPNLQRILHNDMSGLPLPFSGALTLLEPIIDK